MTLQFARELRKNTTDCERLLWLHLRAGRLQGFKFKRQQPLGDFIVDFVCFQTRLIVEADGGQHADQAEYDARRDNWLTSQGFRVLRFWNNDILTNIEGVLAVILDACNGDVVTPSLLQQTPCKNIETKLPSPLAGEGPGERGAMADENSVLP